MKIQLQPLWKRETPVSVYDFFYLVFVLALTMAVQFYPDYPLTVTVLAHFPVDSQTYTLVTCLVLMALAWRRWIAPVRLLLLSPPLLWTLAVAAYGLPATGKPSDFIITAVVIGWSLLFIRG